MKSSRILYFAVLTAVFFVVGCASDYTAGAVSEDKATVPQIMLGVKMAEDLQETRGDAIETTADITTLGLFGLVYPASAAASNPNYYQTVAPGDYIYNGLVEKNGFYWPTGYAWPGAANDIALYAYAPYATDDNGITMASTRNDAGAPAVRYTIPVESTNHPDLIVGESVKNIAGDTGGEVDIDFEHILARVQVVAKDMPAGTIDNIYFRHILNEGTYTIGGTDGWTTTGAYGDTRASYLTSTGTADEELVTDSKTFFMIPQDLFASKNSPGIEVNYAAYEPIFKRINDNWEAGKTYTYELSADEANLVPTLPIGTTYNFAYTGGVQTFTAEVTGRYRIECWGAQGGSNEGPVLEYGNGPDPAGTQGPGGLGGYSVGEILLSEGKSLYVVVGEKGKTVVTRRGGTPYQTVAGGYNGGGSARTPDAGGDSYNGSGGGASHIAIDLNLGVLSAYSSAANQSKVLIVAGGGGGSAYYCNGGRTNYHHGRGGHGGGATGGDSWDCLSWNSKDNKVAPAIGGGKTGGGGFGQGNNNTNYGGGGGGGWYGGEAKNVGGAGGSGYCNASLLRSGTYYTVAGGDDTNPFPSPNGGTEAGHEGNGYCRITFVSPN